MRDDLLERHQGRRERRHLPLALLAAATLAGCGGGGSGGSVERELLLLSGRDDHGLVAERVVALTHEPEGRGHAHAVAAGTLVRVLAARGEWLHVETLEGPRVDGWVNDYYLRGVLHVCAAGIPRSAQAELLAFDGRHLRVRTLDGAHEANVPRDAIFELAC